METDPIVEVGDTVKRRLRRAGLLGRHRRITYLGDLVRRESDFPTLDSVSTAGVANRVMERLGATRAWGNEVITCWVLRGAQVCVTKLWAPVGGEVRVTVSKN